MNQICRITGQEFEITEDDLKFYEKMGVPVPTLCPEERQRRRLAWRNERNLYHRTCDGSGKKIVSMYSSDKPFPVYENEYWWSDKWDPKEYAQDFDFSQPFFSQFFRLQNKVPQIALMIRNCENSKFVNNEEGDKDCYLVFGGGFSEESMYSRMLLRSKNCTDCLNCSDSELCYECINTNQSFLCILSQDLFNCSEIFFSKDCIGCQNCIGCFGLRNKKYHIANKKVSPEVFRIKKEEILQSFHIEKENFLKTLKTLSYGMPQKYSHIENSEKSTGEYINHTKNAKYTFDISFSEDCSYTYDSQKCKDCMDVMVGYSSELLYETMGTCLSSYLCISNVYCWTVSSTFYSSHCFYSHDLLGCVGLRNAQYCILNKQYSKEEYFELKEKIIEHMSTGRRSASGGQNPSAFQENPLSSQARDLPFKKGEKMQNSEWGEFFPIEMSPFGYNETVAQEYFPLTKEEAKNFPKSYNGLPAEASGVGWKDEEEGTKYTGPKVEIPDSIHDTDNSICNAILECEQCSKNYRIVKPEYEFYKKMELPVPHKCPNCRHLNRMKLRNPRKLWKRNCSDCNDPIETTFAPERPEKILCEKCYLTVVQ